MATYSTREAAKKVGISLLTLQRWVSGRKISAPRKRNFKGFIVRLWSERDIERLRRFKAKQRPGRPPKRKK